MSENAHTLRQALGRLVAGLKVDALLFTTFTFDPEFFESNVLPIVTGIEHVATIRELEFASRAAEELGLAVFHDGRADGGRRVKRATYPTVPVFLRDGVFHPKLVIASGTTARGVETRLMVSSANLTFAGWGQQREAVGGCVVDHEALAQPLISLLDWLQATVAASDQEALLRRVTERLEAIRELDSTSPRLLVSLPGVAPSLAATLADTEGEVVIASPYFSPGFAGWLENVLGERTVTLIPAIHGDRVDLESSELAVLTQRPNVRFLRIAGGDPGRFDHLKLLYAGGRLIVGSHNATMAALGSSAVSPGGNVEVSLSMSQTTFPYRLEPLDPLPAGKSVEQKDEERELLLSPLTTWVSVVIDWVSRDYRIEVGEPLESHSIELPGMGEPVEFASQVHPITDADEVARSLQSRRVFRVFNADGELVHEGFINESGWQAARPVGRFPSLRDCFDAWRTREVGRPDATSSSRVSLIGEADDHDMEKMLQVGAVDIGSRDLLETYFSFFRAVRGLRTSFDAAANAEKQRDARVRQLLDSGPGSLNEALRHIMAEEGRATDSDRVFWFVVVHELTKLADEVVVLSAAWPPVQASARRIQEEFAAACTRARGSDWFMKTSGEDRARLEFMLSSLGYFSTDDGGIDGRV